ncbi:MAG: galactose-1-phosphate uridylyltransferase [Candidatus Hinthialibacter sp.]
MDENGTQLRRDPHHGGWVLLPFQPEREQLLSISPDDWPADSPNALDESEASGVHVVWSVKSDLPDGSEHRVRVIANRFAMYRVEGQEDRQGRGLYDMMRGVGAHEIIVESPNPSDSILTLSPYQYALTLQAVQERIRDLRKDSRLKSFSFLREWICSGNGAASHPHSQLIASAIIPLGLSNEMDSAWAHFRYKERCLFCDMIRQELHDESRLVMEGDDYIAYCPFASRYPFEIHLFPKKHSAEFHEEPGERLPALAAAIRDAAARLEAAIPGWRVLMVLHTAPVPSKRMHIHSPHGSYYHWHIEFLPHPPGFVDWYARTGTHVECTPPENAAAFLREVNVPSPWE